MPQATVNDEKNYERLSKPYPSKTDATAAISGFFVDVIKARQKWKIADAVCVCAVTVEGEENVNVSMQQMGSSLVAPVLLHRGIAAVMQDMITDLAKAKTLLEGKPTHE